MPRQQVAASWMVAARHAVLVDLARNGPVLSPKTGNVKTALMGRVPILAERGYAAYSVLVKQLADDGYIERDMKGKRTYRVELTDAGRRRAAVDEPMTERAYAKLPPPELPPRDDLGGHDGHTVDVGPVTVGHAEPTVDPCDEAHPAAPPAPEPTPDTVGSPWEGFLARAADAAATVLDDYTHTIADMVADRIMARYGWTPSGSMIVELRAEVERLRVSNRDLQRELDAALRPTLSFDPPPPNGHTTPAHDRGFADAAARTIGDDTTRRWVDRAVSAGWNVSGTRKGHLRFAAPSGQVVIVSGTPSDHRATRNARAQLRRAGLTV